MTRIISSNNVLIGDELIRAEVVISDDGKILSINRFPESLTHGDLVILPGLVDSHVHLNEPGRTDWEGFETGTKAAAAGGVTTVIDMPLNAIPPTTTVENLEIKISASKGKTWVDVGFWGGVIPGNDKDLIPLIKAGVRGFKCFLIESGVDEFPAVDMDDVEKAMKELNGEKTILMFHAEMDKGDSKEEGNESTLNPTNYNTFLSSRPDSFETTAISSIIQASTIAPDLNLHIVHLASSQAIPLVKQAQENGIKLSAETCYHYLSLESDTIPDKATVYKCCPPIRDSENQNHLWSALKSGIINTIVSDHSPCTPHLKLLNTGDFMSAWGGISSVGLGLTILWTEVQNKRSNISLPEISKWTSLNTAKQINLDHIKGSIEIGKDADFCIFDPTIKWTLDQTKLQFKNKISPYNGKQVIGLVVETILSGATIYQHDIGFPQPQATGKLLL